MALALTSALKTSLGVCTPPFVEGRSRTIVLDARHGKLVKFSLGVAGARLTGRFVQACVGGNFVSVAPIGAGDDAAPLYVVPVRAKGFGFGYDSTWQTTAASYLISGQSTGGIPRTPHNRATQAGMAKVQLTLRTGDAVGSYEDIRVIRQTTSGGNSSTNMALISCAPATTQCDERKGQQCVSRATARGTQG